MSDVTIRPATDADMPAVARIWRVGWPDGHPAWWRFPPTDTNAR